MTLTVTRTTLIKTDGQYAARGLYLPDSEDYATIALPADVAQAVSFACKAVEQSNIDLITSWQHKQENPGTDETSECTVEPNLESALAFEYLRIDRDGQITHMIAMVTDSIYRTAYRLAYISGVTATSATVELSEWDAYTSPLMVGPWMYLTEYFGNCSTLAFTEWADDESPLRSSVSITLDLKIPTGFPAIDKALGGVKFGELTVMSASTSATLSRHPMGGPIGTEWDENDK